MKIKIVDCTFRDGGHLNKWHFDMACVKAAFYAAQSNSIDFFEVGYRNPATIKDLGDLGYCTDEFLNQVLYRSPNTKIAVMIDAGKATSDLFKPCRPDITLIKAVRIAAYPFELQKAFALVEDIHAKGYEVFLNLMASSELTQKEFILLEKWENKKILSGVYFADSFGSFIPSDIPNYVNRLKSLGFDKIGFHSHNNLQLAFANTLKAIEVGCACVDASVFGMGRGSGNLPIEILVGYLEKNGDNQYNTVPYLDLIERFFTNIFKLKPWGYSLGSLMGGLSNVHPYYVEHLLKNGLYTVDEAWNALRLIKERCPISYSSDQLNKTMGERQFTPLTPSKAIESSEAILHDVQMIHDADAAPANGFSLQNKHAGKNFLIIATGPTIKEYNDQILQFQKQHDCITIGVNNLQNCYTPDYHLFISKKRFQKYIGSVAQSSTVLLPSFMGKRLISEYYSHEPVFFDIVCPCSLENPPLRDTIQYCLNLNVAISGILLAYMMGAKEIFIVGMDGYIDELNKKMVYFYNEDNMIEDKSVARYRYDMLIQELDRVNNFLRLNSRSFFILTPTSHKKYYRPFFTK
jgi:4-hydroxy 2-oxovalerate aldolase